LLNARLLNPGHLNAGFLDTGRLNAELLNAGLDAGLLDAGLLKDGVDAELLKAGLLKAGFLNARLLNALDDVAAGRSRMSPRQVVGLRNEAPAVRQAKRTVLPFCRRLGVGCRCKSFTAPFFVELFQDRVDGRRSLAGRRCSLLGAAWLRTPERR